MKATSNNKLSVCLLFIRWKSINWNMSFTCGLALRRHQSRNWFSAVEHLLPCNFRFHRLKHIARQGARQNVGYEAKRSFLAIEISGKRNDFVGATRTPNALLFEFERSFAMRRERRCSRAITNQHSVVAQ